MVSNSWGWKVHWSVTHEPQPWQSRQGFPWEGIQFFQGLKPFVADSGAVIEDWQLAYEEWGPTNGSPIVIFHALTGDSHAASHSQRGLSGWWERVIGPELGLDTTHCHVLCFNALGGAMGSTGAWSLDPQGKPWGSRFPKLTLFDIARGAHALISSWRAGPIRIIGGSMGGMLGYAYAALYPEEVRALMAIGAPIRHEPWAIAFHAVGRSAIMQDPCFKGGDYYEGPYPETGLALARMADMISYQHPTSMAKKFGRNKQEPELKDFAVTSYLHYQGEKLVSRYDANTYITLTQAMDEFALQESQIKRLEKTRVWMVGMESDLLYMPEEIQAHHDFLAACGVPLHLKWLNGPWGHDTFLVDQAQAGNLVARFIQETDT